MKGSTIRLNDSQSIMNILSLILFIQPNDYILYCRIIFSPLKTVKYVFYIENNVILLTGLY